MVLRNEGALTKIARSSGQERLATGNLPLVAVALIGGLLAAFGLAFVISPLAVLGGIAGLAFVAATIIRPRWGLAAALLAQLIIPLYIGLPLVPFLPAFPASLIILVVTAAIIFSRSEPARRAKPHPITIAFAAYGVALALSILLSSAPESSINPFVRCFAIPFTEHEEARPRVQSPRKRWPKGRRVRTW